MLKMKSRNSVTRLSLTLKQNFGNLSDLPADLQKYQLKKVAIPYDVKDHFKKKYSMTWDKIDKVWMCSSEDYDKIVSEF